MEAHMRTHTHIHTHKGVNIQKVEKHFNRQREVYGIFTVLYIVAKAKSHGYIFLKPGAVTFSY